MDSGEFWRGVAGDEGRRLPAGDDPDPEGLSPADEGLVARDPAIAFLDHVLDPARALRLLERQCRPLSAVSRCDVTYLRYKPGVSLLAGVTLGDEQTPAMLLAVASTARSKIHKVVARAGGLAWNRRTQVATDPSGRLLLAAAPHDRDLPGIAAVLRRQGVVGTTLEAAEPRVLRYRPSRRWLAVAGAAGEERAVRVLPPAAAQTTATTMAYLADRGLPVPVIAAHDAGRGVIASTWIRGTSMADSPPTPDRQAQLGQTLARLHGQPPGPLRPGPGQTANLQATARGVAALLPAEAEEAQALSARIIRALPHVGTRVVTHGDLSSDQVITSPDGSISLIDLDRACLDLPHTDLASWAATQMLDHQFEGECVDEALGPVLTAYASFAALNERDLAVFTSAAIFRRSIEPFRHRERDWAGRIAGRMSLARRALGDAAES